jgi:Flp pilus assembly protein TadG
MPAVRLLAPRMAARRLLDRIGRDDRGAISVMLLVTGMIAIVAAAGLVGGGAAFAARANGYSLAQSAARAGAQQIDTAAYRTDGTLRLDPARAAQAAKQFLAAGGATGSVQVTAAQITVTATSRQVTPMLRMFGIGSITVTSTAAATPTIGPPA